MMVVKESKIRKMLDKGRFVKRIELGQVTTFSLKIIDDSCGILLSSSVPALSFCSQKHLSCWSP